MITAAAVLESMFENKGASEMLIFTRKIKRNTTLTNILKPFDLIATKV